MERKIPVSFVIGMSLFVLNAYAIPTVTLTQPVLQSSYQAQTTTTVTYIVNNYVPKTLAVTSISGISSPISVASNGCSTIPAGSLSHPGQCSINITIAPTNDQTNTNISQELQINYGGRTTLKANINFHVTNSTPIVFMTETITPGDMSAANTGHLGLQGADDICNHDAQTYGTPEVKAQSSFKALLIASNRTPCSNVNGVNGCSGVYAKNWILTPNTNYYTPLNTPFISTTANAIFTDNGPPVLYFPDGTIAPVSSYNNFWMGAQSLLVNSANSAIIGWSSDNLTVGDSVDDYSLYFALCTPTSTPSPGLEWTSQADYGAVGYNNNLAFTASGTYPLDPLWTNYFAWDNNPSNFPKDVWSGSNRYTCNTPFPLVCVSQ